MSDRAYDVFLSYNSADKQAVEAVAVRLRDEAKLYPFFDDWDLVPGESIITALEQAMDSSRTIAVFVGASGTGPWHEEERQLALTYGVRGTGGRRIIPVLLSTARGEDVPGFLRTRTWVELTSPHGFEKLVAGIRGRAPGPSLGVPASGAAKNTAAVSPRDNASPRGPSRQIIDELARVFYDRDQAVLVVTRAGFPRSRVPSFRTSQVFWSQVLEEAHNGALPGGIQPIVDEAARMYPGNPIFSRTPG